MDYERDPDEDATAHASEDYDRPSETLIDALDHFLTEEQLPGYIEELEPASDEIMQLPALVPDPDDHDPQQLGIFMTEMMNRSPDTSFGHYRDEVDVSVLGRKLEPGNTLIIDAPAKQVGPYGNGTVINENSIDGLGSSFGAYSTGRYINRDGTAGMGYRGAGLYINDDTVTMDLGKEGTGTFINRDEVGGHLGADGAGTYINTGTVTGLVHDARSSDVTGSYGIVMNFGDLTLHGDGDHRPDILIDPELDEDEYDDEAGTIIGRQTLDETPDLDAYISAWEELVSEPSEDLINGLEAITPGYDPQDRHVPGVSDPGWYDIEQHPGAEQQPHPGPYIEAVVTALYDHDRDTNIPVQERETHMDELLDRYGDQ